MRCPWSKKRLFGCDEDSIHSLILDGDELVIEFKAVQVVWNGPPIFIGPELCDDHQEVF